MRHRYFAYGLVIESEIPLPELTSVSDELPADVSVRAGAVPEQLVDPVGKGVLFEASPNEFLLKMPDLANYLVREGNEIIVEDLGIATEHEMRVFLLGSGFGALLHQREVLVLHASAIGTEAGAVLFAGVSGAGKSTLLGELLRRGHSMMVDDVCAVVETADGVTVFPGYPRTRLWADSAKKLEIETDDLERTRPSIEKFERNVPQQFWDQPAPFSRLYILSTHNNDDIMIERMPGVTSFGAVLANTYRRTFMDGLAMRDAHFDLASKVAAQVTISRVTRPSGGFKLAELADAIEHDLSQP